MYTIKKFDFNKNVNHKIEFKDLIDNLNSYYNEELSIIKGVFTKYIPDDYSKLGNILTQVYFSYKEDLAKGFNKFRFDGFTNKDIFMTYDNMTSSFKTETNTLFDEFYPKENG